MQNSFQCPECPKSLQTLGGWKRHMTTQHNGYIDDQVNDLLGGNTEGVHMAGGGDFESYGASMPDTAQGLTGDGVVLPPIDAASISSEPEPQPINSKAARKMRARMDKLKERLATDIPGTLFHAFGMELDAENNEAIKESIETVFDILGIDFEIVPFAVTIRNRWLVLLYPVAVISAIFGMKKIQQLQKDSDNAEIKS